MRDWPQPTFDTESRFSTVEMKAMVLKAGKVNSDHSLDMTQFIDAFGIEKVKADYGKVADRMQNHQEIKMSDPEKLGHIFEAAFLDLASRHHWFGEQSEVTKASKFDDIMNGIDMITTVLDKDNAARHFEVASDLTISHNGVAEKFNRIVNNIRKGKLATINYFHSELMGMTGKLEDVPRTVIALDRRNIQTFLTQWLREPELSQEQFARIMVAQISAQAEGFARMAASERGEGSRIHRKYLNTYEASQNILETNTHLEMPEDRSLDTIRALSERIGT